MKSSYFAMLLLVGIALNLSVRAEEDVYDEACNYVKDHSTPEAEQKWFKSWVKKADQMMLDNPQISTDSKAADEILLRYLRDRRKKLGDVQKGEHAEKLNADEKLEICRWYLLFKDKQWQIDHDLADFITKDNFKRYIVGDEVVPIEETLQQKELPPPKSTAR